MHVCLGCPPTAAVVTSSSGPAGLKRVQGTDSSRPLQAPCRLLRAGSPSGAGGERAKGRADAQPIRGWKPGS